MPARTPSTPSAAPPTPSSPLPSLRPVDLPGARAPLTRLVLGTMSFGDTTDAAAVRAVVDHVLDLGITAVDTANGYAGSRTETILAPLLRGRRDRIMLATKAGMPHADAAGAAPLSAAGLRRSVDGSLRRLGTDYVDLFYLHQPDRTTPVDETLSTVADLRAEGKIGALGVSNYSAWQTMDVTLAAERAGTAGPVVAQQLYNLVARRVEDEFCEYAQTHGLLLMTYNPLAGGLLARAPQDDALPSRFGTSVLAAMYRDRYWTPALLDGVRALARIADEAGMRLTDLALRWLVSQPTVGAILLGGDRLEHFTANVAAVAAGPLPDDLRAACTEATDVLAGSMPAYHR
ncbi:MAG TPA: aldo/keto reductase [Cellulomonas sp.]